MACLAVVQLRIKRVSGEIYIAADPAEPQRRTEIALSFAQRDITVRCSVAKLSRTQVRLHLSDSPAAVMTAMIDRSLSH